MFSFEGAISKTILSNEAGKSTGVILVQNKPSVERKIPSFHQQVQIIHKAS